MRRTSGAPLVLALALLASCSSGGDDGPRFALDGSPRVPDDEGIVTAVDLESVTLDGDRVYDVDRGLVSFSAIDLSTVPLLFTEGQYVQVGTDGDEAKWIGTIAKPLASDPPRVVYSGAVDEVADDSVTFQNGTVLRVDDAVDADDLDGRVQVWIDPRAKTITEVGS